MKTDQLYQIFRNCSGVSTDSRKIDRNCMFFALKGDNFDGNLYAADAIKAGAACAVVDNKEIAAINESCILVENTLRVLQDLAKFHRRTFTFPVLAITGSNGKTTTKELTSAVIGTKYTVGVTRGNLNNHIGVPVTLLSMNDATQFGVVEMGANHPGEIDQLCKIAEPEFGLITNIGKAHLEGFGSFEGVIQTKTELYRAVEKKGGTVFLNADNELLVSLAEDIKNKITYGTKNSCFLRAELMDYIPFVKAKADTGNEIIEIQSRLTGSYNFENIVAATCMGSYFGIEPKRIKEAIESYIPTNNRSQIIDKGTNRIILDAYNANPSSMMASINNFLSYPEKRKTIILGDMLELGSYTASEHQRIVDLISDKGFTRIILVGNNFESTNKPAYTVSVKNVSELQQYLFENPITDSLILIKGSRGIQLELALKSI